LSDDYNNDFDVFVVVGEIGYQWFLIENLGLNLSFGLGLSLDYAW
jgi:hypothetical protein